MRRLKKVKFDNLPRYLILLFVVVMLFGLVVRPVFAAQNVTVTVNSGLDNTLADDKITLREAILIIHGKLDHNLTTQERAQIVGSLDKAKYFNILIDADVTLDAQLPNITKENTAITSRESKRRFIDGQKKVAYGFFVKAAHFDAATLEFRNFTLEEIHIEAPPAKDHDFTILGIKFTDGKKGLVFDGLAFTSPGKGKIRMNVVENEFTNLSDSGISVFTKIAGDYDFRYNILSKLDVETAVKLEMGRGAGDITVSYLGNTHSTKNGTSSIFEEFNHTGKIKWEIDSNHWLGGKTGLSTRFAVDGAKNFSNNEYLFHTAAGLSLKTEPINNVLLKIDLDAESIKQNNIGWLMDIKGKAEISTRLFDVIENKLGVDGFVSVGAEGSWKDRGSKYNLNTQIGVRLLTVGGVGFDLFYKFDQFNNNGKRGIDVAGFHDSLYIDNSEILSNGNNGIAVEDTHSVILKSIICFNGEDGIHITGDSNVVANRDIIDVNGPLDVNNLTSNFVDATHNDWGPVTADEMNKKPYPSNISVIHDVFDSPGRGFVAYLGWDNPGKGCSALVTPTVTPTITPTPTVTPSITITPTISVTPTSTPSVTPTITITPTATPSGTTSPSITPTI